MSGFAIGGAVMRPFPARAVLIRPLVNLDASVSRMRSPLRFLAQAGWLLVFSVLALGWQIALFVALFGGVVDLVAYLALDVLGCAALAAWPVGRLKRAIVDERNLIALQIVAWSALAGPFGAFAAMGLVLAAAPGASSPARDGSADARRADPAPRDPVERAHTALLDGRMRLEGAARIRPLTDVIAEGSRSEKLEALRVVYRNYDGELSAALKQALQDPDASVRVLAATVVARLHGAFGRAVGDRQTEAVARPGRDGSWLRLAEARLAYAESGLLEAPRARAQIELAVADLSRAADLDPVDRASIGLLEQARRKLEAGADDLHA
jgi:hypothetical protein